MSIRHRDSAFRHLRLTVGLGRGTSFSIYDVVAIAVTAGHAGDHDRG